VPALLGAGKLGDNMPTLTRNSAEPEQNDFEKLVDEIVDVWFDKHERILLGSDVVAKLKAELKYRLQEAL
jgi:hypothetical protein